MKILVTGANGYLGQGIVKELLDYGHEVIAADLDTQRVDERAQKIKCNVFDVEKPYQFFGQPDVLLHLAWRDGFAHYSDVHVEDLPRHFAFIKKMIEAGISKVTVLGSMHEVGFYEGCIGESTYCQPITPYGISKNALRELVQGLAEQKSTIFQWIRGYYIVGNSQYGSSIFSKITKAAESGKTEFPITLGQNQYDFIDYEDFCRQISLVISQNEINGIIEMCSGKPEKLADRVERFIRENNYHIRLIYGAFPDRPYDSKAVWGDNTKLKQILSIANG